MYKRNYDSVLLRCVDRHEAESIIREIREGSFGTHASGHSIAKKILRASYFWMTMESDCYVYAKMCLKCQVYAECRCNARATSSGFGSFSVPLKGS